MKIILKAEIILKNGIRTGIEYDIKNNALNIEASVDMRKPLRLRPEDVRHTMILVNARKGLIPLLKENGFNVHNNRIEKVSPVLKQCP